MSTKKLQYTYTPRPGTNLIDAAMEAVALAEKHNAAVRLIFNDIAVVVRKDTTSEEFFSAFRKGAHKARKPAKSHHAKKPR